VTQADGEEFDSVLRGVAASPDVALPPSSKVGERFLLFRTLGEGSFGVVYEAQDRRDGRRVARWPASTRRRVSSMRRT
jgi:hypothetical protein